MRAIVMSVLVVAGFVSGTWAQGLPTTGAIETRLGTLELVNGFPTEETVTKIYDGLDFQRACQAYIWALPYMAMTERQRWTREEFGAATGLGGNPRSPAVPARVNPRRNARRVHGAACTVDMMAPPFM